MQDLVHSPRSPSHLHSLQFSKGGGKFKGPESVPSFGESGEEEARGGSLMLAGPGWRIAGQACGAGGKEGLAKHFSNLCVTVWTFQDLFAKQNNRGHCGLGVLPLYRNHSSSSLFFFYMSTRCLGRAGNSTCWFKNHSIVPQRQLRSLVKGFGTLVLSLLLQSASVFNYEVSEGC